MAASLGNAMGAYGGVMKYFEGRKLQKEAKAAQENFEWQELTNTYENNQVSTLGSDLKTEQALLTEATAVDALQSGGTRAIIGGLGRVGARKSQVNKEVAAELDTKQKAIDMAASGDEARIQGMTEKRQTDELAGIGQMANVGMGLKYQGVGNVMNAAQAQGQVEQGDQGIFNAFKSFFGGGLMGGS